MKYKLLLILTIASISVKAQQADLPNYILASQISIMVTKLGMPVDSAASYLTVLGQFKKTQQTATDVFYGCKEYDSVFDFQITESGQVKIIICDMPVSMLNTAQKAIVLMGMTATGTAAPPGFTAYATPQYAAFLNPEARKG
ncbi:MAG TPA: hypothetical protein VNX40_02620, partial [Mucilaginibacter sp.]|nr:hypothetical protein [Mucilaginibacter sp.]